MPQYARPDSDISVAQYTFGGRWGWWASTHTDALYTKIDEATPDDTDYAWYKSDGSDVGTDFYKAGLSDIDEPSDLSSVSIRVRIQNTVNCNVRLYEGSTRIKSFFTSTHGSITNVDTALTSAEAGSITDWTDLRLWFGCNDQTRFQTCYIYYAYLEAGNATSPAAPRQMIFQPTSGNPVQNGNIIVQSPKGSITGANTISTLMGTPSAYMLTIPTTGTINANFTGAFTGCAPCAESGCESCS